MWTVYYRGSTLMRWPILMRTWLPVAGMICSMTVAQILFKMAGLELSVGGGTMNSWILNIWLWVSLIASGLGLLFWLVTLRHMPLSVAHPWTAMIYVLTPLCSVFIFNESLTGSYVIGMVFIVFGIYITTSSFSGRG